MIKQFDRPAVRAILDECEAALKVVADKHGLRLARKGCSFRAGECPVPFKLMTVATGDNGEVVTAEARDFERCAVLFGLKAEDLGREFSSRGKRFKICGAKPANRKYPILAKCLSTGKVYKFPEDQVVRALAA
jgi:hypothetical protein